jgi:hypothetical protein
MDGRAHQRMAKHDHVELADQARLHRRVLSRRQVREPPELAPRPRLLGVQGRGQQQAVRIARQAQHPGPECRFDPRRLTVGVVLHR